MYDAVCLSSGGLDSLVCLHLLRANSISALPLFIDYGQRSRDRELSYLELACEEFQFAKPLVLDVSGFGQVIRSGLTDQALDVFEQAFTPGRNLLFLTLAGAVAYSKGTHSVVLGFLSEETAVFPDQSEKFVAAAERALCEALGVGIRVSCPLREFVKADVVRLGNRLGVRSYYSCHAGGDEPCGTCIACLEYGEGR